MGVFCWGRMYKVTITPPNDLFRAIKALPKAAQADMRVAMNNELKPAVKKDVIDVLAPYPGPVVHPFEFTTAKSRRYYFAVILPKNGGGYVRTMLLFNSWSVDLVFGLDFDSLHIYNAQFYSKFVLPGRNQVPGHARSGWGRDFQEGQDLIREDTILMILDLWRKVVRNRAHNP